MIPSNSYYNSWIKKNTPVCVARQPSELAAYIPDDDVLFIPFEWRRSTLYEHNIDVRFSIPPRGELKEV